MSAKEFDNLLNNYKRDVSKAFNMSRKYYMQQKWNKQSEDDVLWKKLFDHKSKEYLSKKLRDIDNKANNMQKVNTCLTLIDYYERFCNRLDNPTLNMIEVEMKREIYGPALE